MNTQKIGAIALTGFLAFNLSSCGSEDTPGGKKNVEITYGEPEISVVSFTSAGYNNKELTVPVLGEESNIVLIAKQHVYEDGILSGKTKQSKVADMKVESTENWIVFDKSAVNDSTLQLNLNISENRVGEKRDGALSISVGEQKFNINITQEKAVIEYGAPVLQSDCSKELLFSKSGDTERKVRFRVVSYKTINGNKSDEYTVLDASGWSWKFESSGDFFYQTDEGEEEPGIRFLKIKAKPNQTGNSINGFLQLHYSKDLVTGSLSIPLVSDKGFIIDIDDGSKPEFN